MSQQDLPVELIDHIVAQTEDKKDLVSLLTLSRAWCGATERTLYRELVLDLSDWSTRARKEIRLLEWIASNAQPDGIGIHVHSIIVAAPLTRPHERRDVEQKLVRALMYMPNLKSLHLSALYNFLLDSLSSNIDHTDAGQVSPSGSTTTFPYPFQLESFHLYTTITGQSSEPLDNFLSRQPLIHTLSCHYPNAAPSAYIGIGDAQTFLPKLNIFAANSDVSLLLVKGRPVTHCRVIDLRPHVLELLMRSSQPIVGLSIDTELNEVLDPHAWFQRLEFLSCLVSPYSRRYLVPFVTNLGCIRRIRLLNTHPDLSDSIASELFGCNPSLNSIDEVTAYTTPFALRLWERGRVVRQGGVARLKWPTYCWWAPEYE